MSRRDARWNTRTRRTGLALTALVACCSGCLCPGAMPGRCLPYASMPLPTVCDGCGDMCGGACAATEAGCGPAPAAFPASCGTRATGGCGGLSGLMLPLLSTRLACGSGCGDVYWGEWLCDPPECCDACNDDGCWAGTAGLDPYGGYGGGCLQGILAGPAAIVQGTYLGVTSLLQGTCSTVQAGCRYGLGSGYGYSYGQSYGYPNGAAGCDCADCTSEISPPACSSCGVNGCGGACVQRRRPVPTPIAAHALGTGVAQSRAARAAVHSQPTTKPPHRLVAKRLRR